MEFITKVIAMD